VIDPLERLDRVRAEREAAGLRRRLTPRDEDFGGLIDLASNDYLGLTRDPRLARAASDAAAQWGTGATGSRLVTGTTVLHAEAEAAFATFVGAEAALLFSSGYLANLAAITALAPAGSLIVSDAVNHASIVDACRLARATTVVVPHRDTASFARALDDAAIDAAITTSIVATDSVFSVDGDAAPLTDLLDVTRSRGAALLVDEAHSLGVTGPGGRGALTDDSGQPVIGPGDPVIRTATLSKSFGAQGGLVIGPRAVIDHVIDQARPFIFDTALAPPSVAAALAALQILIEEPQRAAAAVRNSRLLASLATAVGLDAPRPDAAVVSIRVGAPQSALIAQRICREHGVLVGCFRPPSTPDEVSRLRLTARADLDEPSLARIGAALAAVAKAQLA
jgi:8-amino-7-oxononanoate synthase